MSDQDKTSGQTDQQNPNPATPPRSAAGTTADSISDTLNRLVAKVHQSTPGFDLSNEINQIKYGVRGLETAATVDGPTNTISTALDLLQDKISKRAPGANIDGEVGAIRSAIGNLEAPAKK